MIKHLDIKQQVYMIKEVECNYKFKVSHLKYYEPNDCKWIAVQAVLYNQSTQISYPSTLEQLLNTKGKYEGKDHFPWY